MSQVQNKIIFKIKRAKSLQNSREQLKKSNRFDTAKLKKSHILTIFPVLRKLTHMLFSQFVFSFTHKQVFGRLSFINVLPHHLVNQLLNCPGLYSAYCSPCAIHDMAEEYEPGSGVLNLVIRIHSQHCPNYLLLFTILMRPLYGGQDFRCSAFRPLPEDNLNNIDNGS